MRPPDLSSHVLELVVEFDFLGDGHAILGDARRAERFFQHDVAALGPQRHPHGIGKDIDAAQHLIAGVTREFDFLGSHFGFLLANLLCVRPVRGTGDGLFLI
jgi:hypothetical protein